MGTIGILLLTGLLVRGIVRAYKEASKYNVDLPEES